ncbi:hypothetical protein RJ641_002275 [Dillenia turbinata]|uniref:Uncharacterized protein n=1 Tax=Dillenia turbinata TaxID=194707 RepID=A0AAN8VN56_9MAGN
MKKNGSENEGAASGKVGDTTPYYTETQHTGNTWQALSACPLQQQSLVLDPSLPPTSPPFLLFLHHLTYGGKLYGGIRIPVKKGRASQLHVSITNVTTEISPSEPAARVVSEESQRPVFPFAAIVGQDEMKLCLLLNVIDPKLVG